MTYRSTQNIHELQHKLKKDLTQRQFRLQRSFRFVSLYQSREREWNLELNEYIYNIYILRLHPRLYADRDLSSRFPSIFDFIITFPVSVVNRYELL